MRVVPAGYPKHLQNQGEPHLSGMSLPLTQPGDCANPPETNCSGFSNPSWGLSLILSPRASQQGLTMERMTKAGKKPMIT